MENENIEVKWKKRFAILWTGQTISIFTSAVIQMALIWYLIDRTKSAAILSLATMVGFVPRAVLGPFIGVFVDRYDRKTIMIIADVFIAVMTGVLVAVGIYCELPIWLIMVVLFLRSIGEAFHVPSLQAITPMIVPKDKITNCAGYVQGMESISLLLSPAVAAVLYGSFRISNILLFDVVGAGVAMITIVMSKIPSSSRDKKEEVPNLLREAREGMEVLRSKKGMFSLTLIGALYAMIYFPIGTLYPLLCMSYFGGSFKDSSVVEIIFSAGTLLGALLLGIFGGKISKIKAIISSIFVMGVGLLITGILQKEQFPVFVILAGIMGLTIPFYHGVLTAIYQLRFEEQHLGRVLSLSSSLGMIAMPLGLVLSGVFADKIGVNRWFLLSGIFTIMIAIFCRSLPSLKKYE